MRRRRFALAGGTAAAVVATLAVAGPATSAPAGVSPSTSPAPTRSVARAAAAVTASTDRADALAAARSAPTEPLNSWRRETLPAGDVDWFHYRVAGVKAVSLTLGGLPADYDLAVFDDGGRQLATSTRKGRVFDEVWIREPSSELFARVVRKRGAAAGTYGLRLRPITKDFQLLSAVKSASVRGEVFGEFYNATRRWGAVYELDVEWLDRRGRVVKRFETYMTPKAWIAPGARFPFTASDSMTGAQDGRSVRVRAKVKVNLYSTNYGSPRLTARITKVHTWRATASNPGGRTYEGTMTNTTGRRVDGVYVDVCDYDAHGTLKIFNWTFDSYAVPAHGRRSWGNTTSTGLGDWSKQSLTVVRAYQEVR